METNEQKIKAMKLQAIESGKKTLTEKVVEKVTEEQQKELKELSSIDMFARQNPAWADYLAAMVAAETVITIGDFEKFDELGVLDAYTALKALHENKKLGRLAEMLTGVPWENVVVKKEFEGPAAAVGEIWKANVTK